MDFNVTALFERFTPTIARVQLINSKIMERVLPQAAPDHLDRMLGPCLLWQGPSSGAKTDKRASRGHSYPRMTLDGQTVAVHRVLWVNTFGYLPGKKQLDHLCKVRNCVSPFHCEKVTHKENQKRRDRSNGLQVR
jgi:hypothetical protein